MIWTFISPAEDFLAYGESTGSYILSGEELTLNERGESMISYADYAAAFESHQINCQCCKKTVRKSRAHLIKEMLLKDKLPFYSDSLKKI